MKQIALSANKKCKNAGKYVALVDDEDYDRVSQYNWSVEINHDTAYAYRKVDVGNSKRQHIKMHRFIMGVINIEVDIDHKNQNGLDNQKSNLRVTTHQKNTFNTRSRKNSTSQFKGVSFKNFNKKVRGSCIKFLVYFFFFQKKKTIGFGKQWV